MSRGSYTAALASFTKATEVRVQLYLRILFAIMVERAAFLFALVFPHLSCVVSNPLAQTTDASFTYLPSSNCHSFKL